MARSRRRRRRFQWRVPRGPSTTSSRTAGTTSSPSPRSSRRTSSEGVHRRSRTTTRSSWSRRVDIGGFGGVANSDGRIAAIHLSGYLMRARGGAHVRRHRPHVDPGGRFQYAFDLMASNSPAPPRTAVRGGDRSPTSTATASSTSTSTRATPGGVAIRSIEALLTYKDTLEVHVCRARSRAGVQRIVLNTLRSKPFVRRPREMAYTNAAVFDATEGRPREALQAAQDRGPVDGHVPIHRPRLRTADAHARRDGYGPAREKGDRR